MGMLRTAAVFSDHMVFQRGKVINIWGTDFKGREVTVTFKGETYKAICEEHNWKAYLPPQENYEDNLELIISDGIEEIKYMDICIGEVWLAGGQSNMEFELQNSVDGAKELEICENYNVRFYYTKKNAYIDDYFYVDEENSSWQRASSENSKCWSAVGYYFAKEISEKLGCTVGVIGCNWGGTSASAWISTKTLLTDEMTAEYVHDLENAMNGKTLEEYIDERRDYFDWEEKWQPKINEYYSLHPTDGNWEDAQAYAGKSRYPEPLGPMSPFRAGGLYETMLKRVMPYTLRGVIYYQGESDDHRPNTYYRLMKMLIEEWRDLENDPNLPIMFVQLPFYMDESDNDTKSWCIIREAQMKVHQTVANTGLAVTLECGELHEIHPREKRPFAHRLALQALFHVYNKISSSEANSPTYKSFYLKDDKLVLEFYDSEGMYLTEDDGFEVSDNENNYYKAHAEVLEDKLVISSKDVKSPANVRYAWENFGTAALFGKNNIPASPFRIKIR